MPTGPEWHCKVVMAQGNIIEENRSCMVEELELWFHEPVECVKELLSNLVFKDYICYTPEHVYSDSEGRERIFDEMWMADWWWETQVHQTQSDVKILSIKRPFFMAG